MMDNKYIVIGLIFLFVIVSAVAVGFKLFLNPKAQTSESYVLTVVATGSGAVISDPAGIMCGFNCSYSFNTDSSVILTATPATGYTFTGWSGACTGTGICTVTINNAKSVTATFRPPTYLLTVNNPSNIGGTIISNPSGIDCGSTCSYSFNTDSSVILTATPATGYVFDGWSGDCAGTETCTVNMNVDKSVNAKFKIPGADVDIDTDTNNSVPQTAKFVYSNLIINPTLVQRLQASTVTIKITNIGKKAGSTTVNLEGKWVLSKNTGNLNAGDSTIVTFNIVPDSNCPLGEQSIVIGDMSGTLTIVENVINYQLTTSKSGAGSGTIISNPSGIDCGLTCAASYSSGTSIILTASASSDSTFTGWSGACTGTGTCTVIMDANKSVTATFAVTAVIKPSTYLIAVVKSPTAGGAITSSPGGMICGATCSYSFNTDSSVILTATPATGYTFTGWSGACTGTGTCNIIMDSNKSITATFRPTTYLLTVNKSSPGSEVSVVSSPAGITCGVKCLTTVCPYTCSYSFNTDSSVTLTPMSLSPDYTFTGWSGACTGTGTCTVIMDANKSVTATFDLSTYSLTVTKSPTAGGTIISIPEGVNCGSVCSHDFELSVSTVTLIATPATGYTFTGWSGDCSGTGICNLSMTANRSATATFSPE